MSGYWPDDNAVVIFCSMLSARTPPLVALTLIFGFLRWKSATSLSRVALPWSACPCHMVIVTVPLADVPSDEPPEQAETTDPLPPTATRPTPPRSRARLDSLGACLWCTGTVSLLLLGTFPRHRPGISAGHNWPTGVRH